MNTEIIKDIGDIYARIFNHGPFLKGEIKFILDKFELERGDREVDNLFSTLQTIAELKSTTIPKCIATSKTKLPDLKKSLEETLAACEEITNKETDPALTAVLEKNRETRKKAWEHFIDDMNHKRTRIDYTFEEKTEELTEFYSDLERKLQLHK